MAQEVADLVDEGRAHDAPTDQPDGGEGILHNLGSHPVPEG